MKIRILSDLHLDINYRYPISITDPDVFTVIAGDLGGDYKENVRWLRDNVHNGIFISGNHDAYTPDNTPLDDVKEFYHRNFPEGGSLVYCDNDVGVISRTMGNIMFIGDVLYTDYRLKVAETDKKLGQKETVERNMWRAGPKFNGSYMNDFRFFTRKPISGGVNNPQDGYCFNDQYYITPRTYLDHFNEAFEKITQLVEANIDKDIVLVTHHCLSRKCISGIFSKSPLNASYVSPKDDWIRKHPNIRLVISGHVHHRDTFKVGNALYVLNPLGYCRDYQDRQTDPKTGENENWTPNLYVNTDTWTVEREPYEKSTQFDEIHKREVNYNLLRAFF